MQLPGYLGPGPRARARGDTGALTVREFLDNTLADAVAGASAHLATHGQPINISWASKWEKHIILIAKRLACLEVKRWESGCDLLPSLEPLGPHV